MRLTVVGVAKIDDVEVSVVYYRGQVLVSEACRLNHGCMLASTSTFLGHFSPRRLVQRVDESPLAGVAMPENQYRRIVEFVHGAALVQNLIPHVFKYLYLTAGDGRRNVSMRQS